MFQNIVLHLLIVSICICTIHTNASKGELTIRYLKGVHRFNDTGYTDYYFCCNAYGRFLRWQFNDEPLTGFVVGHVGRVVVDTTRSTFEYTATLLSSQPDPENNQQAIMDSVFVVSFSGEPPSTFEITCSSNSNFSTEAVGNMSEVVRASSNDSEVVLDYILSRPIVQNKNKTHIFVCGALDMLQYFEINGPPIGFSGHDDIGQDRTVLSENGNIVNIQGVLIARRPYTSTALLFVSEDSDVNVTCYFGSHQAQLSSGGHTTTPEPSTTSLLPYPTVPPSSSLAPIPSMLASPAEMTSSEPHHTPAEMTSSEPYYTHAEMTSSEPHYTHGPYDVISSKIQVIIACGFISFFIFILLGITTTLCYVWIRRSARRSASSSLEAPKDETPAEEKELPPKNMEKLVIGTSFSLEAPKDETPAEERELPPQTMAKLVCLNIIRSLCGNINATTREHSERSNQDSVEEKQPLIQDFIIQPNCCNMEDVPVFVTHELEQQPEDKLAAEWLHACPVYLDKKVPSENYSLGNAALIVGAELAAGSFSKMVYISEDTEAVYIMEDHAHDNEDRVIKEEKPCFKWMTLPGQDDVEEFTDIPEWESPPVLDWYQPLDQPKIRLEGKRKISPEEEKEIPDVEREIPEVSPEETEIAEVSPEESQIPEGSPEETEMPEVSPEETEIPEVSTKEEVELPKVFSEEAIKERPWELFEDSPDEEDEVLKVGPEEENVPEDAHANPRDVYDLCPVNLIDTERFCVKVFRGVVEILRRSVLSLQKSIRVLELMMSSDTSYPRVSYLPLTYMGYPTNEKVRKLQEFNLSIFQWNQEAMLSIPQGSQSNLVSGRVKKLQYDLEGFQPLKQSSVFTPGGFRYTSSDEDLSQSRCCSGVLSYVQKILLTSAVSLEKYLSLKGLLCVSPPSSTSTWLGMGIIFDG